MQSGGPNRERLYRAGGRRAGGSDGRADRVRVELNGNPVQSGGLNRERLYRAGFNPPQAELNGRERDRDDSLIVMIRTGGSLMCTSFSSFHVLNRVNIVHLIYTSILNPQSSFSLL